MIRFDSICKKFRGRPAVDGVSFEVGRGEIFGLLGHNGAGKSTTFGIALGHVHADSGQVHINGHDVASARASALARVGAIFETPAFYDYLSGWKNLRFFVSLSGPVPQIRMEEVIRLVGLEDRIHDPVRTYSHGMRQRLALAQALLPDPELIILDEPTEGLDPAGIHEMRSLIRDLRTRHGLTVILSSHLLHEVEQLCDRVAILHRGSIAFCGRWQDAGSGRARWILETQDSEKCPVVLAGLGIVIHGDGTLILPENFDPAEVVRTLVMAGVRVREFRKSSRTLEDFYLETTG
ncbi:MAG: ABC transporter ATP-binding protein [Verrucomicrobiaceae bacterium]|nr:MAG: ABC transporter ATP-binding protein [Verrucomicrobiaceae bacterium]